MEHSDFVSIDDQLVALYLNLSMVTTVGRVILEHVDLWEREERRRMEAEIMRGGVEPRRPLL